MRMPWHHGLTSWRALSAGVLTSALLALSGPATAGIADTKHNLGSGPGPAGRNTVSDTAEICVFCHTPHGGSTDAPVPLWNKRLSSTPGAPAGGGSYITYASLNTPSLDGTVAPVGSISVACLSCHDGTQAMDNVINAPGSGGVVANGGDGTNDGTAGRAWTWTSPGNTVNAEGRLISGAAALGTDLSNDHPIGIQYCGGGLTGSGGTVSGTCKDGDFKPVQTQDLNGNQIFWVDTGGGGKQRTDLPLYQRATGGLGPMVECASCHDPHVSKDQAGPAGTSQVAGETFLRISNASSAVCTACHVK